jgi:hypothetical protein
MAQVPFSTRGDGKFSTIAHDQHGAPVEIAFMPDGRVVERRTMAEAWLDKLKRKAAVHRDVQRPGSLIGTQRHRLKTFEIPAPLAASLTRRFGPYRKAGREWHKWLATHAPHLLTSGYSL